MLTVGTLAPDFSLSDENNTTHALVDYRGKWVVLYFYPKDMTPGCTVEACDFRDNMERITAIGAVVLGVSADTAAAHKKFIEKKSLNFPLLADIDKKVCQAYGVWGEKKFMGRTYDGIKRTTFIIDPEGMIAHIFENVKVSGHVDEVLKVITSTLAATDAIAEQGGSEKGAHR